MTKKNRRGNERWYRITRLRWLWPYSTVNQEIIRKRIEAYLKRKNEQAAFLAEKEWRRPYIPMCVVGLIFPPCGRCIFCCLVTRKVPGTALVAEPTTRAVTSHGVDATLSFLYSFVFLIISATCSSHLIPCISKWREESKEWNIASFE